MSAADEAGCDTRPAFLPARPITQADLVTLTERVRRRVIRWFRLTAPEAPAPVSRSIRPEPQAQTGSHRARHRECRQAGRGCDRRAWARRARHGRPLRRESKAPLARHLTDCLGHAHGPGGGRVSAGVPTLWWRHPIDRVHHRAGTDPEDPDTSGRAARTAADLAGPRAATDWGELVQVHDDRDVFQGRIDELPAIDIHSL